MCVCVGIVRIYVCMLLYVMSGVSHRCASFSIHFTSSLPHSLTPTHTHPSRSYSARDKTIQLWFTTSVPPYGYGQSHGLSSIVRLLSFSPFSSLALNKETEKEEKKEKSQILQDFVRWHCRLSHAKAHTRTITLDATASLDEGEEGEKQGALLLERLWEYLSLDASRLAQARDRWSEERAQIKEKIGSQADPPSMEVFGSVFEAEVDKMKTWPCGYFESPLAESLWPVCEGVGWVNCPVEIDMCRGEPPCPGSAGNAGG